MSPRRAAAKRAETEAVDATPEATDKSAEEVVAEQSASGDPTKAETVDGSAEEAKQGTKRKAEDGAMMDDPSPKKEPTGSPETNREEEMGGKSRICRVDGCDVVFSTAHECRARACQKHCSALFVRLKGARPDEQFRFCYQCHKFHPLDNFRGPTARSSRGTTARSRRCRGWSAERGKMRSRRRRRWQRLSA